MTSALFCRGLCSHPRKSQFKIGEIKYLGLGKSTSPVQLSHEAVLRVFHSPLQGKSMYLSSKITGSVFQSPSMSRHSAGSGGMLVKYSELRISVEICA